VDECSLKEDGLYRRCRWGRKRGGKDEKKSKYRGVECCSYCVGRKKNGYHQECGGKRKNKKLDEVEQFFQLRGSGGREDRLSAFEGREAGFARGKEDVRCRRREGGPLEPAAEEREKNTCLRR